MEKTWRSRFFLGLVGLIFLLSACAQPVQETATTLPKNKLTQLKLEAACKDDPLIAEVKKDLKDKISVLELMKVYLQGLEEDASPTSPYIKKLERLFACGLADDVVEGHFYGLTLVLKKGEHPYGGFLNQVWGTTLGSVSPWDGKMFQSISSEELEFYTQGFEKGHTLTFLGINCFREYEESLLNIASMKVLSFWMRLKDVPEEEKLRYGYDKKGGLFIARKAESVDRENSGKDVFQLNYRWKNLRNPAPPKYLIDEIVRIADGLYLGELLLATEYLFEDYDPEASPGKYKYENFGYFLLMDDRWNKERERLFPAVQ